MKSIIDDFIGLSLSYTAVSNSRGKNYVLFVKKKAGLFFEFTLYFLFHVTGSAYARLGIGKTLQVLNGTSDRVGYRVSIYLL